MPKPGDRFVNRDYGATLRAIAEWPPVVTEGWIYDALWKLTCRAARRRIRIH